MIFGVKASQPKDFIGYLIVGGYYLLAILFITIPLSRLVLMILK